MKAQELALKTNAKLTMPSKSLLAGLLYRPSFAYVKASAPAYLAGSNGRCISRRIAHPSAVRANDAA